MGRSHSASLTRVRAALAVFATLAIALLAASCGGPHRARHRLAAVPQTVAPTVSRLPTVGPAAIAVRRQIVQRTDQPPRSGPPAAAGVVMISRATWVLIGGLGTPNSPGPGVIERTVDGGRQWRRTFAGRNVELSWIGRDGRGLVAAGDVRRRTADGSIVVGSPLLLRSRDGGRSWHRTRPRIAPQAWGLATNFAFSGHGGAIAVPSATFGPPYVATGVAHGVLVSADDGRHWRIARLPGDGIADGSAAWTPGGRVAYVTGYSARRRSRCANGLWRSANGGGSWTIVRGTCNRPTRGSGRGAGALGVAFPSTSIGLVSGGGDPKFASGQVVSATRDGGRRWHRLWRARLPYGQSALVKLAFTDRRNGYAVPGGADPAANVPYAGDVLVTSDGGHDWRDTGQPATTLSALPGGWVLAALDTPAGSELALTRDAGRRWTELTSPRLLDTAGVVGGEGTVTDLTAAGTFASIDGGATWGALAPRMLDVHSTLIADQPGLLAAVDAAGGRCMLRVSHDGGARYGQFALPAGTRRRAPIPGAGGGGEIECPFDPFAFNDARTGLALAGHDDLYTTTDGGASWQDHGRAAFDASGGDVLAASARLDVALETHGPNPASEVFVSTDFGRSWSAHLLPAVACSDVSALQSEIWVTCDATVYHSTDAGSTWTALTGHGAFTPVSIAAVGPGRAIASDGGEGLGGTSTPTAALWETSDGGASWTLTWPTLPVGVGSAAIRHWTGRQFAY